jgi:3-oxoacyl-(acyl-carrier-protein) synthase
MALLEGRKALAPNAVLGAAGGDLVPLALLPGRALDELPQPAWLEPVCALLAPVNDGRWGDARHPVFITSSNFGVGSLHAFKVTGNPAHLESGANWASIAKLRQRLGWGPNVIAFSHACVSSHLGLVQAARMLNAGVAEEALVFSYDFLSPFVAGGFHALKILNSEFPAPYQQRESGSIGLGDGAAYAVLGRGPSEFTIEAQALHNELYHFTANQPDGAGFQSLLAPLASRFAGRRLWVKGHGTGTLEAGRLEATSLAGSFPGAPLVGWKGSLGHTLGSCGLVELAVAIAAIRKGRSPGTVGSASPTFTAEVATTDFDNRSYDGLLCLSNAFGGAHAALVLGHA